MSLSARQRILKLRETEYKLQKLQADLLTGENEGTSSMADFLAHHKELMSLPTKTKNTLPFSFNQSPYYQKMTKAQKLTLPPKIDPKSNSRMMQFKDPIDESEKIIHPNSEGLARHPSLALQTLYQQLEDQTAKMATSIPKIAPGSSSIRFKNVRNSQRYLKTPPKQSTTTKVVVKSKYNVSTRSASLSSTEPEQNSNKAKFPSTKASSALQKPKFLPTKRSYVNPVDLQKKVSKLLKSKSHLTEIVQPKTNQGSPLSNVSIPASEFDINALRFDGMGPEQLRNSIAYALTASNMMGVVLKPDLKTYKKGPLGWSEKTSLTSTTVDINKNKGKNISAKEVLNLLKRKVPDRAPSIREHLPPHQRGLIGVEISGFEPECAFFYRDRNGQFNPHLQGQKSSAKIFRGKKPKTNFVSCKCK
ncbi:unnamed protein product [Orchesella dallaii]|uniref:Uncharacterized protein n=1 Tax=Orchesella dallaii TaxID=48710 RepID=A0ABP1RDZ6_9HEXA